MLGNYLLNARKICFSRHVWRNTGKSFSTTDLRRRRTHYEVLGVSTSASTAEIKQAFVTLSKQCHPDHNHTDPESSVKFIRLTEAYTTLVREQARREYDMSIGVGGVSWSGGTVSRSGGGGARVHESEGVGYEGVEFRAHHMYRGGAGVRRVPNYVVAGGCMGIVLLGFLYFLLGYRYTIVTQRERLDALDRRNSQYLRESKENARQNGFERQLEILVEREEERKREIQRQVQEILSERDTDTSRDTER